MFFHIYLFGLFGLFGLFILSKIKKIINDKNVNNKKLELITIIPVGVKLFNDL